MSESKFLDIERAAKNKLHSNQLEDLNKRIKRYEQTVDELQSRLGVALGLQKARRQAAAVIPLTSGAASATAFAVCSDWHTEENVTKASVNGLNEYNLEIADQRITKLTQSIFKLLEIERHGADIDTLVLPLLGDFMTGFIHEENVETNELTPTQTILWLLKRLGQFIATLRAKGGFKRIIIPCSYGNHGRTTKKPRHATAAANSYEWMMYRILAEQYTDKIEWQISESYHNYLEVYGRVVRMHHGDGLKYQGGVGGLTIPVEKAIAKWNTGRVADLDIFGHWHTKQENPKWVSNGPLIGYSAYSIEIKAPFEPPSQTFFLYTEKRGRTVTAPIFLT